MQNVIDERKIIYIDSIKVQKAKLRVAAYARVSSESEEQLNSFSAQVNYYNNYISQREDWELVDVYADEGVTGVSIKKRTDFKRMISDCEQGKIDKIITKSISRFARNNIDAIETTRKLKSLGISVLFENENMDTEALSSEYLLAMRATFAQQESMNISQNVKKGKRSSMIAGTFKTNSVPYGYRYQDGKKVIVPEQAQVVKRIFNEYLNGKGTSKIAETLRNDKILTNADTTEWYRTTIISMLRNESYVGDSLFQKYYTTDEIPYTRHINRGQLDKFYVKATHESIISREEFDKVNELLKIQFEKTAKNKIQHNVFNKKIQCNKCSATLKRKVSNDIQYWVCRAFDIGKSRCSVRYNEKDITHSFLKLYQTLKENYKQILTPIVSTLTKIAEMEQDSNTELKAINAQIAELYRQNQVLTELMSSGILDSAIFISQSDEINKKLRDLKTDKKRIVDAMDENTLLEKTEELISILEDGPDKLYEIDEQIFNDIVSKITAIDKNTVEFVLINGLKLKERI